MHFGVWLSLVERIVRDDEAAGSNPVTPMKKYVGTTYFFVALRMEPGKPFSENIYPLDMILRNGG